MDPDILKDLTALLMVTGGVTAVLALVAGALAYRYSGMTKFLGIFISVGFMSAAMMLFVNSAALTCYAYGEKVFYLFWLAFSGLISIITGALIIYRLFPDEKQAPTRPEQEEKEEKEEKQDEVPPI